VTRKTKNGKEDAMTKTANALKLIRMSDIETEEVHWLWKPYLPAGKITIVQGDPGEGKTTFILQLVSLLTQGKPLPEQREGAPPISVIYQTAEDGLADTIKPRLETAGADCDRVLVIDECEKPLSFLDERIEQAIRETGAKLFILDPLQAYLGDGVDMHRANEVRPIFKRLGQVAETTGCAVILIGHMNKIQGAKSAYRGLGSIDFRAAARSVLLVGRSKDDPEQRIVVHDKSSLAPEGKSIAFRLDAERGFQWEGFCETTADELLSGKGSAFSKTQQAENLLKDMLCEGEVLSETVQSRALELGVSTRTLKIAKQRLGIKSIKRGGVWYTQPPEEGKEVSI